MIPMAPGFFKPLTISKSVALLIHPIDSPGNTYTDSSGTNKTIAENGGSDLLQVTTGGQFGNLITVGGTDASTWLNVTADADFEFDGDFTIAAWINIDGQNYRRSFMTFLPGNNNDVNSLRIYIGEPTNVFKVYVDTGTGSGTSNLITSSSSYTLNTWTHLALTRQNGTLRLFLAGSKCGEVSHSEIVGDPSSTLQIFGDNGSSRSPYGQFEDILIVKDYAMYTVNFTPPTSRYDPNSI